MKETKFWSNASKSNRYSVVSQKLFKQLTIAKKINLRLLFKKGAIFLQVQPPPALKKDFIQKKTSNQKNSVIGRLLPIVQNGK